jgi:hypothetical protein
MFVNNATANLYLKDTSTGWQSASSTVLTPLPNNSLRSTSYTSGLVGWNVNAVGDAEFNNLRVRGEILASVFKVSELSATAGTFGVFFSAANLSADFTTPTVLGFAFTFHAKNSDAGGMLFGVGDILRFKGWTGSGIADAWATVASRTNNGTSTTYSATLEYGSTNVTFVAGTAVVDYGPSGTGFITLVNGRNGWEQSEPDNGDPRRNAVERFYDVDASQGTSTALTATPRTFMASE